jgi:hypothetical protein
MEVTGKTQASRFHTRDSRFLLAVLTPMTTPHPLPVNRKAIEQCPYRSKPLFYPFFLTPRCCNSKKTLLLRFAAESSYQPSSSTVVLLRALYSPCSPTSSWTPSPPCPPAAAPSAAPAGPPQSCTRPTCSCCSGRTERTRWAGTPACPPPESGHCWTGSPTPCCPAPCSGQSRSLPPDQKEDPVTSQKRSADVLLRISTNLLQIA